MIIIVSPLSVPQTKTEHFILNMNVYRNTHYQTLNKVKINYKKAIQPQIAVLQPMQAIELVYTVYPATKRLFDTTNVCCVHSKFFLDSLVELAIIPDDNYLHVRREIFQFGAIDRLHPRVEIAIHPLTSP